MQNADYLQKISRALASRDGISKPDSKQLAEADVYARIAQAHALTRIAGALEALAADTVPAGMTVQPAIRHSA
ncbi:hypothetical protein [Streptomyces lancefieldiae]|uniref:Uncharacterized protein n=1 Tax=Streptomyces lancefieldiae TaxID=3075520 RepID=A0ABU3AF90_9ACTN|nr:hypothetical protein [Streptomyces sp. DSM 40712]MDT0608841.1 hypothetical protein [Streptomyces sp. DSM 40712]